MAARGDSVQGRGGAGGAAGGWDREPAPFHRDHRTALRPVHEHVAGDAQRPDSALWPRVVPLHVRWQGGA